MSKYGNSGKIPKIFKFLSSQVFQIFDSKHGSPEYYSDFFLTSATTLLRLLILLRRTLNLGFERFFSPKLLKPRRPFFYTSKYGNSGVFRKKIKFFSLRVFQIFNSKHGSPGNYSDFFFLLLFFLLLILPNRGLCVLQAITSQRY